MMLFNSQMTVQSPVCKAVSKIRDSSLPIYSILWGFLIAGNNSQNIFHYMPQRQNKDLSQEMEPKYIPRHTLATSDHASDQHMHHWCVYAQLRARGGCICPWCGELFRWLGEEMIRGQQRGRQKEERVIRRNPTSLLELSPPYEVTHMTRMSISLTHMQKERN